MINYADFHRFLVRGEVVAHNPNDTSIYLTYLLKDKVLYYESSVDGDIHVSYNSPMSLWGKYNEHPDIFRFGGSRSKRYVGL